jgi:hypothetical protein
MVRTRFTYCEELADPLIVKIHCSREPLYSGDKRAINGQPLDESRRGGEPSITKLWKVPTIHPESSGSVAHEPIRHKLPADLGCPPFYRFLSARPTHSGSSIAALTLPARIVCLSAAWPFSF